ncbi:hypothetical protein NC652_018828 [Populus alba x Populus x berolinensis]|nr:hypothetical protein NC652_018828 [Populus alba x Populus x berolinensis]
MVVTDAIEEPSPSSNFSQPPPHHFYVTVVDKTPLQNGVAARCPALPNMVCCTSRDQLDAVCSTISTSPSDANLVITWSRNPQSRLRSDPGKPK